jgi:acyl-CoA thioesterase-1
MDREGMDPDHLNLNSPGLARRSMLISLCAFATAGCGRAGEPDVAVAPPIDDLVSPMPAAGTPPDKIVTMLGDSITAGYGLPAADALPAQLEKTLKAMGLAVRVRAAGVSGDTSAGGLVRVDSSVQADTDLCIVALGGNDMLQGIDPLAVRANLRSIIDKLQARDIPVLLAGMKAPPQYGRYATDFDRIFTDLAREDNVPAYPFLLNGVALDRRYNQADGIHPNAEGVKVIVTGLAPTVAKLLAPSPVTIPRGNSGALVNDRG